MQDLEKLVQLGREFAKPWKQATKVLAVLLVFAVIGLFLLAYRDNSVILKADLNSESQITQTQG